MLIVTWQVSLNLKLELANVQAAFAVEYQTESPTCKYLLVKVFVNIFIIVKLHKIKQKSIRDHFLPQHFVANFKENTHIFGIRNPVLLE